jgi:hypothetical protein
MRNLYVVLIQYWMLWLYRVSQKPIYLKYYLVLMEVVRCKPARQIAERYHSVHRTCRISFRTIFVKSVNNTENSNVF